MSEQADFREGEGAAQAAMSTRERVRLGIAVTLGVLVAIFALLNLDEVEVNWIFGTWSTPMIVVIAVSGIAGAILDRIVAAWLRHRRSQAS